MCSKQKKRAQRLTNAKPLLKNNLFIWYLTHYCVLDDPTPMPESALLMATAQIMAEGGAKHSPFNCNTANSKTNCAASKKAKSGAARKRGANLCFCAAAR